MKEPDNDRVCTGDADEQIRLLIKKIHKENIPERLLELARALQAAVDARQRGMR